MQEKIQAAGRSEMALSNFTVVKQKEFRHLNHDSRLSEPQIPILN